MRHHRISLACGALLFWGALTSPQAASSASVTGQQQIEEAIRDYAANQATQQLNGQNQLIANNASALLDDPMTPVIGNPGASVTITEFFDYTCPYCKAVEPRLEQLLKSDPKLKLIVKEFPILTPESLVAAKAALAAEKQGKYARYHQAMMMFRGRLTEDAIFDMAKESGLDIPRLRRDMQAPEITDEIIKTFNLARAVRVFQTPAFIVNTHLVTGPSAEIDFPKLVAAARAAH